jgi:arylsulfatase A-like enzyme
MSHHDRPNLVYLHPADLGRWIQPYGHAVHTPNLQRLAEQGVTFRNAFCTSPSRAALLTGCYPVQNGMTCLTHHGGLLRDPRQHLVHTLKAAGYTTALLGHQHVHPRLSRFDAEGRELTPDAPNWRRCRPISPPGCGPGWSASRIRRCRAASIRHQASAPNCRGTRPSARR